ncbi:precorrin-6A synthase (deacetylating) [Lampropedia puyangensis]|uniref:Precorrin-6A synthase (Deacetylating) n=1 Tax=Lampropedia puyangensis TaxID=1330072 RepID=A0A4S8F709_9BURK|nr:precorrin-6A synthase (deacetylating) [Lampropedia puyangensis]THU02024.1 precorrin-6A synthase (deacetylating) [Lampropedia puyangensis]
MSTPLELALIGIGTGHPEHLTREAERTLRQADLILLPHKGEGKEELAQVRLQLLQHLDIDAARMAHFAIPLRRAQDNDYLQQVDEWHAAIAQRWQATIAAHLQVQSGAKPANTPLQVALLVWGDPALYDSSLRIAARLQLHPEQIRVVPGISSLQVLCSEHRIALNNIGEPFTVTTGRKLLENGWPHGIDTIVVMLDGQCSFNQIDAEGIEIYWGAYLGLPQQILLHGPLQEVKDTIVRTRQQARTQHGWIMDIYLLRKR